MNAPLPEHIRKALETVTLDDKYSLDYGQAFMSGVQALVKLPMLQRQRDALQGKNTAGFISGYRGSPLGGYDQALWKASSYLKAQNIVFQPGVNEELAATALWGTQQLGFSPPGTNKYDGVFGIWYGKGPGVDRCSDVFKHANMAGTTPWGGVIAVAGDDHVAKSSTAAHQSDHIFKACGLPVFFPTNVQEILDLGVHAFAMSRFSGVWAGMKTIQEIVESSATAMIDPERVQIKIPLDFQMPPGGVHIRWPDAALDQEARLFDYKWYAALAYIRANRLNYNVIEGPNDRFGIIASGKAYNDTRQALIDLGLDDATCRQLGIRLHKVGVVWPLEAQGTREFATGLQEILVVEEKRQVIEYQLKEELYNWRADVRPNIYGKFNEVEGDFSGGEWSMPNPTANTLLRANADLSPSLIARAIAQRVRKLGLDSDMTARIDAQLAILEAKERSLQVLEVKADRQPWFCSGCPHNTSTKVPEGSRAMAGIGCHFMALWMDRSTSGFTQMGGEGVPWVGQQPFTTDQHIFANLGDGTYFHSGSLAVRQSIASGVNITYKILYNDAVAMTGGQQIGERPEGLSVVQIAQSMRAEGAAKIVVVTDEPEKYDGVALAEGVTVHHRDELDTIQRQFREIKGTTVIIYDQTCATEKRRRRKRGTMVDPAVRVVINELVCEGCGDCSVQSNCLSVEPLETEFGRKRQINQSTCNKDMSCLKGFCPSFVTVEGGQLKKKAKGKAASPFEMDALPQPQIPATQGVNGAVWGIVVAGVGGTGVITIGQLLGMAGHIEGKGIVTQDAGGLAQKGGATWSHVLIGASQDDIRTTRVGMAGADLIIGCDPIVTAGKETVLRMREGRTHVALNSHSTPTAAFVHNANWQNPAEACAAEIAKAVGLAGVGAFNADAASIKLMGDSIYTNPMMLGYAWQKGWIPLEYASLMRAIELNAVAVDNNKTAFEWGRRAAHDLPSVEKLFASAQVISMPAPRQGLPELVARRVAFLTDYQNAAYAKRYESFVNRVQQAESALGKTLLTQAVAKYLFKLMAYKDEYEVARLHTDRSFLDKVDAMFEGDFKLNYHLAPPMIAKQNDRGELQKQKFGPWMLTGFKLLARLKGLRGTALDPFGRTEERRMERGLIARYEASIEEVLRTLDADNHAAALDLARIPELIKGYGHVKARHVEAAQQPWSAATAAFRQPVAGERQLVA
ncbi:MULTISPECIES: indolepyruvate ferredoxin oxidoreductase family protein [unclassified Polaromonas]|jgi:indolepyruvate ferredoxin oxidoreductase|uniref:indolepyruvate ferredoxin oxidoreductase family protein n=1 Tax=unclassified Polaromonas TaxID=2638319 RepID=UPI000BDC9DC0|nr:MULTISPECIES: indolepyruvate ferredoxin oxidoreductase family protein [unclassified Polaromonas]OYY38474.1 MAG: indolepyruvate ferredoxin oxidoreductase [Polaromonas sp. 35-63-35]OYZ21368.1 MAG: indolepyruvate ferredoxin oxidoreductase [Polaromonas sp. 16-63-31]OYZ79122.1 MAG: indolepyruvate ferredoxin oxidoreductase [Polaromonas sp. 24-63-21]OZA50212.1 MAG: indolepyruvate ferredoxin oxidoreductase [Polaromonas sp. 17-63-33]OZA89290.1 MAG: indolepyruvate ferredoxin oxidoreductase [Polaromon